MPPPPDSGIATLHVRCGSDLAPLLKQAGFVGEYLEYSDPFCQGPLPAGEDWLTHRAGFLAGAYGPFLDRDLDIITAALTQAEHALTHAAVSHERVVLWCEHDSYDQLMLARCLGAFATSRPAILELVQVNDHPGSERFVGLGQLPANAFPSLWRQRQQITREQIDSGVHVWDALREPDPRPLASLARTGVPGLPFMAAALHRHCQEFPSVNDGLGLTERLVLELLSQRPYRMGEIFHALTTVLDPLPFLGDVMLRFILESMKRVDRPVFTAIADDADNRWFREALAITVTGQQVLHGTVDFLSLNPPDRHLGGATISPRSSNWRWDERKADFSWV